MELLKWRAEHDPTAVSEHARDGDEETKLKVNIALNDAGHGTKENPATWQKYASPSEWRTKEEALPEEKEPAERAQEPSDDYDVDMDFRYSETPLDRAWGVILKNIA